MTIITMVISRLVRPSEMRCWFGLGSTTQLCPLPSLPAPTPVSVSPARMAYWMGAAPRHRGRMEPWTFTHPNQPQGLGALGETIDTVTHRFQDTNEGVRVRPGWRRNGGVVPWAGSVQDGLGQKEPIPWGPGVGSGHATVRKKPVTDQIENERGCRIRGFMKNRW